MTLLCVSLVEDTLSEMMDSAKLCKSKGAEIIEFRLDYLKEEISFETIKELSRMKGVVGLPLILTVRPSWEGGYFKDDEEKRQGLLKNGIELGFDYIDIELNTEESRRKSLITHAKENNVKIIVSYHDFEGTPKEEEILFIIKACIEAGGDIAKVVFTANSCIDGLNILQASKETFQQELRFTALGMGPYGYITRYLGSIFGCEIVYASIKKDKQAVEGQLDIDLMKNKIQIDKLNPNTQICGIIGSPLGHTLSPAIHNAAFSEMNMNYIYLPFEISEHELEDFIEKIKSLNFRGLSVTHPYKKQVLKHLDVIGSLAQEIGAVNTVVNDGGALTGYNTDSYGAMDALKGSGIDPEKEGYKVLIIGAGGAASSVAVPLVKAKSEIIVVNRTRENGLALVEKLNKISKANFVDFKELGQVMSDVDIVINCTSCGMKGCLLESPIEVSLLREDMIVFDMVYSPMHTRLLTAAEKIGAKVIYGYEMFIHQGIRAFELWTDMKAPKELMRKVVIDALNV